MFKQGKTTQAQVEEAKRAHRPALAIVTEVAMKDRNGDKLVVKLTGEDGNSYSIIARCRRVMRDACIPNSEIEAFSKEAMSGSYDFLLQTVMQHFDVE